MAETKAKSRISKIKTAVAKTAVKKEVKVEPKKKLVELPLETGLKQSVFSLNGKVVDFINLPKEIFGVEVNKTLVNQYVRVYLANQRRGTLKTKSRGEIKLSTRKIYRQKGTGRARHGAASAPIFVGGGVAFGPKPRDFSLKLSKKMKKIALSSSLSAKVKEGGIRVVTGFSKIEPKTKNMTTVMKSLDLGNKNKKVLIIVSANLNKGNENIVKAARNIKGVTITSTDVLNTYDVLRNPKILFMKEAVDSLKESFLKENK